LPCVLAAALWGKLNFVGVITSKKEQIILFGSQAQPMVSGLPNQIIV
jgi:hypothetical protein